MPALLMVSKLLLRVGPSARAYHTLPSTRLTYGSGKRNSRETAQQSDRKEGIKRHLEADFRVARVWLRGLVSVVSLQRAERTMCHPAAAPLSCCCLFDTWHLFEDFS
jgi:hypothetical protein